MNKKSFTLIELLVVIVIIGILAGVIMISTSSSINKAGLAKAQVFSSTIQNELLSDLVSEWIFDEPQIGNETRDTWKNNHGIVNGATYKAKALGECILGGCYSFDGQDDNITIPTISFNSISISIWIYSTNLNQNGFLVSKGNVNEEWQLFLESNNLKWTGGLDRTKDVITVIGDVNLTNNQWHHLFVSQESKKARVFVDGVLIGSRDDANNLVNTSRPIVLGAYIRSDNTYGYYFNGRLDDVRIYDTALSFSKIKQNYIAGLDSLLSNGTISRGEYYEKINTLAYE